MQMDVQEWAGSEKICGLHISVYQRALTVEEALNNQGARMACSVDVSQPLQCQ